MPFSIGFQLASPLTAGRSHSWTHVGPALFVSLWIETKLLFLLINRRPILWPDSWFSSRRWILSHCRLSVMNYQLWMWMGFPLSVLCSGSTMYEVCPDDFRKIAIKKTVIVSTFCIFSFCQYGRQRSSRTSSGSALTAGAPRRSSPPCYFSYAHLSSYWRPPER